jgi:hypothetical protein
VDAVVVIAAAVMIMLLAITRPSHHSRARMVSLWIKSAVDFSGARECGEAIGRLSSRITVRVREARAWELLVGFGLRGVIGFFGRFGGVLSGRRGFIKVSTQVADGSCAGIGPDAAAEGDVLKDVDALVC